MATPTKVPFGLLDGVLVEPASVANGLACGCVCPGCHRPLIAYNQGQVRTTQYFGHAPGVECAKGIETAIHLAGKQALLAEKRMRLPALVVDEDGIASRNYPSSPTRVAAQAGLAIYTEVEAEVHLKLTLAPASPPAPQASLFDSDMPPSPETREFRPDIKASAAHCVDWIEICVTHPVDLVKQQCLQRAGLRVIEVDLRRFLTPPVSLEDVKQAVIEDINFKTWIANPYAELAAAEFKAEGEAKRRRQAASALRASFEAEQRERLEQAELMERRRLYGYDPATWADAAPAVQMEPTEDEILAVLRVRLKLSPTESWPRHLDLNLRNNGGSLVPTRIWLSELFLDCIQGRTNARYLLSDLVSWAAKRGTRPRYGYKDLETALTTRVLPYWAKCEYVRLLDDGRVVIVAQKAGSTGGSQEPRLK